MTLPPTPPLSSTPPLFSRVANALTAPTSPEKRLPSVDKSKVDPDIKQAAEGMEAMFLDYLMKVMRQTVPKNEMDLESSATGIYRAMLDSETAERAARSGGIGLADQIIAYLQSERYAVDRAKGGDHEGQPVRKQSSPIERNQ